MCTSASERASCSARPGSAAVGSLLAAGWSGATVVKVVPAGRGLGVADCAADGPPALSVAGSCAAAAGAGAGAGAGACAAGPVPAASARAPAGATGAAAAAFAGGAATGAAGPATALAGAAAAAAGLGAAGAAPLPGPAESAAAGLAAGTGTARPPLLPAAAALGAVGCAAAGGAGAPRAGFVEGAARASTTCRAKVRTRLSAGRAGTYVHLLVQASSMPQRQLAEDALEAVWHCTALYICTSLAAGSVIPAITQPR